jgi:hypothetical protein
LNKKTYKQFATQVEHCLYSVSTSLTLDELYKFQCFIYTGKDLSHEDIRETLSKYNLSHIEVGFIDYEAFSFKDGKTVQEIPQENLWEQYILGILNGTLKIEEISEEIGEIPLDTFAKLLHILYKDGIDKELLKRLFLYILKSFFRDHFQIKK